MKNKEKESEKIICYFDGACSPNNPGGYMGWGAIIQFPNECKHIFDGERKSESNSNNVAEYLAFITVMQHLERIEGREIVIYGDSNLVIQQMKGNWKINQGLYKMFAVSAKRYYNKLIKKNKVIMQWIPRELNEEADKLSNEGIKKVAGIYIPFFKKPRKKNIKIEPKNYGK